MRMLSPGAGFGITEGGLSQCFFHFAQPIRLLQHFARFRAVGRPHDPIGLHEIDQVRGAAVADTQPPLQKGSGRLAELDNQAHGVLVKLVMLGVAVTGFVPAAR